MRRHQVAIRTAIAVITILLLALLVQTGTAGELARRAFRRPVTEEDVARLMPFYEAGREGGGSFDQGIEQVVAAVLAKLIALRSFMRARNLHQPMADGILEKAGLDEAAAVRLYRLTAAFPASLAALARDLDQQIADSNRNIADYNVLYGSIGAVIALLVWMYVLAVVALIGCEYNAAMDKK